MNWENNLNIIETTKATTDVFFNCETLNDISLNKDLDGKADVPGSFRPKSHYPPLPFPQPNSSQEWPFNKVQPWDLKTTLELLIQSLLLPLPLSSSAWSHINHMQTWKRSQKLIMEIPVLISLYQWSNTSQLCKKNEALIYQARVVWFSVT